MNIVLEEAINKQNKITKRRDSQFCKYDSIEL